MSGTIREEHESDQSRYASECDLCETDGSLHMFDCPNNPRHASGTILQDWSGR